MAKIRATSTVGTVNETIDPITGEIELGNKRVIPDVQSAKLKSLLSSLKK
jgi:hypothetical protein